MRKRNLDLYLAIVLGVLIGLTVAVFSEIDRVRKETQVSPAQISGKCEGLKEFYDEYNDEFFRGTLPKDTVVDYSEQEDYIATTSQLPDGRYKIAFNEKYASAPRVARIFLLHEQCHVQNFDENDKPTRNHGKRWRACMVMLDIEGAFRQQLIDSYDRDRR
jgi:SprT-like family protein